MTPRIQLTDAPDPAVRDIIVKGLVAYNEEQAGPPNMRPLAVLVSDPGTGEVVGGLWGRTSWRWLFIELLFVPGEFRGTGLGADLMRRAEEEAARRGCVGAWVDTYSFQARGFYERLGYTVFGAIEDYPPGHARFFLQKRLPPPQG